MNSIYLDPSVANYQPSADFNDLWNQLKISLSNSIDNSLFSLALINGCLSLQRINSNEKPICVDFSLGKINYRRQTANHKNENIAKAIGLSQAKHLSILDLTGGLGQDAFIMASLNCSVTIIERHPIIAILLRDGLFRAEKQAHLASIIKRMTLIRSDSYLFLKTGNKDNYYNTIYIDPMFPERKKSAKVKKEMLAFQDLLSDEINNYDQLLQIALKKAINRVVVKRPRLAEPIANHTANFSIMGKTCRYDIYILKTLHQKN